MMTKDYLTLETDIVLGCINKRTRDRIQVKNENIV
jgi:hypothetical protein